MPAELRGTSQESTGSVNEELIHGVSLRTMKLPIFQGRELSEVRLDRASSAAQGGHNTAQPLANLLFQRCARPLVETIIEVVVRVRKVLWRHGRGCSIRSSRLCCRAEHQPRPSASGRQGLRAELATLI